MRDQDVRLAVRSHLMQEHQNDDDTLVVEEMGIWHGSVRIDIAVINGEIAGYELKSAKDTLERLPNQAALYNQVFNRVHLVAAEKHLSHAIELIPKWWGILVATDNDGTVSLNHHRKSLTNPQLCPTQLARLLWKDEALSILEKHGHAKGVKSASREKIAERLATSLTLDALSDEVRFTLKRRQGWLRQHVSH